MALLIATKLREPPTVNVATMLAVKAAFVRTAPIAPGSREVALPRATNPAPATTGVTPIRSLPAPALKLVMRSKLARSESARLV